MAQCSSHGVFRRARPVPRVIARIGNSAGDVKERLENVCDASKGPGSRAPIKRSGGQAADHQARTSRATHKAHGHFPINKKKTLLACGSFFCRAAPAFEAATSFLQCFVPSSGVMF